MSDLQRIDSTLAMKSILSAYGEDEIIDDTVRPDLNISGSEDEAPLSQPPTAADKIDRELEVSSLEGTPQKKPKLFTSHNPQRRVPATKLVSYGADDVDDDEGEEDMDISEEEGESIVQDGTAGGLSLVDYNMTVNESTLNESTESGTTPAETPNRPRVELPPEPTTKCSNKLQEKITNMYRKRGGMDLNSSIQNRKDFRNPSIYEKLITYCNIDEKGTNYPPELFNPLIWGKESLYDELAKAQKIEMDRREKEKKERTKVEFVTGTKKKQTPDGTIVEQKRKSKWDSQPANAALVSKPVVITTTVTNPPVISTTTNSAGIKTTVISVTGTLKKPK